MCYLQLGVFCEANSLKEKKMNTLMEQKRLVKQQQLDSEYIAMKEAVEAARTKQLSAEAENSRLQKLLEDSLKMFHHQRQQEKAALEGTSSGLDEPSSITSAMVATRNSSSFSCSFRFGTSNKKEPLFVPTRKGQKRP